MTTQVNATFINGMLKPDQVVPLAEKARVRLTIEPLTEQLDPMKAWQSLKEWIKQKPLQGLGRHLNRDELHERR
jgi:predicted DNA-binding antitoxin AbrB/MazE fold protein